MGERLLVAALAFVLVAAPVSAAAGVEEARLDRLVRDPRVTESSGLAASVIHDGVLWTHNDSGDEARLYAVGPDGATVATLTLAGQEPRDWEAIAAGTDESGRAVLYVGDIGDNSGSRDNGILVHRLAEPEVLGDAEVPVVSYRLRYPDGPVDAEALLVDPREGRLLVVTKGLLGGIVYAAPLPLDATSPATLEQVGTAPPLVTGGAFLPDGRVALRGYGGMWVGTPSEGWGERIALPAQPQGESLAAGPDGTSVYVGSEGEASQVWRVPLPPSATGGGRQQAEGAVDEGAPTGEDAATADASLLGSPWVLAGVAAGVAAAALVIGMVLSRRRAMRRRG